MNYQKTLWCAKSITSNSTYKPLKSLHHIGLDREQGLMPCSWCHKQHALCLPEQVYNWSSIGFQLMQGNDVYRLTLSALEDTGYTQGG